MIAIIALTLVGMSADVVPTDTVAWAGIVDAAYQGVAGAPSVAGIPMFRSVGDALIMLPVNGSTRTVIFMRNGRYREKLTVDRPRITLRGESRNGVVLSFDATADTPSPGGSTYGTRGSYTLRIVAPDFRAEHLTIENAFDYPANSAKAVDDPTKLKNAQAVAVMMDLGSDRTVFDDVRILGHQDTLFVNCGRSYFHGCEIAGSVDFIFGAGQAVFENCEIVSRDRGNAANNGYITAPSTDTAHAYGFLFVHSRLTKQRATMAAASVTLGRPWHPFADPRAVGSSVFIDCYMDDHIGAKGWDRMSSVDSTGTRVWYEPEQARFFEYGTVGPGAVASVTRRVLSKADAARITKVAVLSGWDPLPLSSMTVTPAPKRSGSTSTARIATDSQWKGSSATRVEELFQGRFPGVRVIQQPGGIAVEIRGATSVIGRNSPLYIIDGFPVETGPEGLITLNPNDIARIEILKDAGSIAEYGVRGANGVVVITTKRTREQDKPYSLVPIITSPDSASIVHSNRSRAAESASA